MKSFKETFLVDETNSDQENLFIDVDGIGTVLIKREPGVGMFVDVFPLFVSDQPAKAVFISDDELLNKEG